MSPLLHEIASESERRERCDLPLALVEAGTFFLAPGGCLEVSARELRAARFIIKFKSIIHTQNRMNQR